MTMAEAQAAMALILNGDAAPEAVGALLMVMRLRGETADEIAGFTAALRAHVSGTIPQADLDWPGDLCLLLPQSGGVWPFVLDRFQPAR